MAMLIPSPQRIQAILFHPKKVWHQIAVESTSLQDLYFGWILWLAAIPIVCDVVTDYLMLRGFLGSKAMLYDGYAIPGRIIQSAATDYLLEIAMIAILAQMVMFFSKVCGGQPNLIQATKTVAYAYTPIWLSGTIAPFAALLAGASPSTPYFEPTILLGIAVSVAAGCYAIYQAVIGLPITMHCPSTNTKARAAAIVVTGIVATVLLSAISSKL